MSKTQTILAVLAAALIAAAQPAVATDLQLPGAPAEGNIYKCYRTAQGAQICVLICGGEYPCNAVVPAINELYAVYLTATNGTATAYSLEGDPTEVRSFRGGVHGNCRIFAEVNGEKYIECG